MEFCLFVPERWSYFLVIDISKNSLEKSLISIGIMDWKSGTIFICSGKMILFYSLSVGKWKCVVKVMMSMGNLICKKRILFLYLNCTWDDPYFLFNFRRAAEILYLFKWRLPIVVHFLFMIVHDLGVSAKKWKRWKAWQQFLEKFLLFVFLCIFICISGV
jgi:hypothetical protein